MSVEQKNQKEEMSYIILTEKVVDVVDIVRNNLARKAAEKAEKNKREEKRELIMIYGYSYSIH